MCETEIKQVHLCTMQPFQFFHENSELKRKFNFLNDEKKYFKMVVTDANCLRKKKKEVKGIGKLRSVLDVPESKKKIKPDSFFSTLQHFYTVCLNQEMDKELIFPPHFPCAIDILPAKNKKYEIVRSTLPDSLQEYDEALMSISMRIYPVGLGVMRFGCFLSTENNFEVKDIIDYLWNKETCIKIGGEQSSIHSLIQKIADATIKEILDSDHNPPNWQETHSIIDIVDATGIESFEKNNKQLFSPLMNLNENVTQEEIGRNLSDGNDLILPGKNSLVTYLPNAREYDRRIVRRWFRNFIELYSIQQYLSREIDALSLGADKKKFSNNWKSDFVQIIKSNNISPLFSRLFNISLHQRDGTFKKESWKNRYKKILEVLDQDNKIQTAFDSTLLQLINLQNDVRKTEERVGNRIEKFVDVLKTGSEAISPFVNKE